MLLITLSFWHYKGYFLKMQLGIGLFFFFLGVFFEGAKMSKIPNLPATKHVTQGKGTGLFSFLASLLGVGYK